jgi:hypothetical protein
MSGPELRRAGGSPFAEHPGQDVSDRLAGTGSDGALAEPLRSLLLAVRAVRGGAVAVLRVARGVLTG